MADHLDTQNAATVAIDEQGRKAQSSAQFFLETDPRVKKYYGNQLDFKICGEEGFRSIAKDLNDAKESADIICWGFDPGMELDRTRNDKWPRGHTYGSLLEQLADQGVKVRLLIWFNSVASAVQNNMPGYTDTAQIGPFTSPYPEQSRQDYCRGWWFRNLGYMTNGHPSKTTNLQIVLRDVSLLDANHGLQDEKDQPSASELALLDGFGTHHQKPILIDYAYDGGSKAVGYVMGLNSVTDFWDRTAHEIDDPFRESWSSGSVQKEIGHETATENKVSAAWYKHAKPYQDYACRVVGPALERLHQNFVAAWNEDAPSAWKIVEQPLPPKIFTLPTDPNQIVQIVRTQAHEREKTIKALYMQATTWARNYIYIENQYFFYPELARNLKDARLQYCRWWCSKYGKPPADIPKLHLFIVIPHPEQDGMVPRTHDMLSELGHSDAMEAQGGLVKNGSLSQNYPDAKTASYDVTLDDGMGGAVTVPQQHKVLDRISVQQLERTYGLEVSIARLRTSGLDAARRMAYREIYIHSKLMLIDDVFVTVGSANINQRSMAVDSEINIAASGQEMVGKLRQKIFELHSDKSIHGTGDPERVPAVFQDWNRRMQDNGELRMRHQAMQGFLLKFEDHRSTATMVASTTVPADVTV
ncbi:phospholipase D1/2 [Paraburkholderia sp. BL6669N2]|uniref:phospholipase D-like domain-containing protein n=1 Tax=Paraburkholderia sp. BL6669N2 TaxID=1938807 RepID=UPI000E2480F4|nr:phospholipase D-like domain-containing protein [Paraburkholderia sp. BL6669N2]REG61378.1 phospholipase D1/2 [Paraburkholderia sp. BL6669N2]